MAQVHLIESRTPECDHADVLALEDIQHTSVQRVIDEGTDVGAVAHGYVSVTPIALDMTNHSFIDELAAWQLRVSAI
jgi:broad specificity polyphosphatase/5'/3'-nucleotidase SurE